MRSVHINRRRHLTPHERDDPKFRQRMTLTIDADASGVDEPESE
jgi:hypothetical protein